MIKVFYGPKSAFELLIPKDKELISLRQLASKSDAKGKIFYHQIGNDKIKMEVEEKEEIELMVAYSDDYAGISESAIGSFISFISEFNILNMNLQNPPDYIVEQLQKIGLQYDLIEYEYQKITTDNLKTIKNEYDNNIIGQQKAGSELIASLYMGAKGYEIKPTVLLFYGNPGIGKTETAKYLSKIVGGEIFRKQFSMFQNNDFAEYLFGSKHSKNSFARELLERESNIILLDEFDKPNPVFHSAFYQLFDEGVYTDKNYKVSVNNAVIICTSNYKSEKEIKENLGVPIHSRFDACIKFEDLTKESIREIFEIEYMKYTRLLNTEVLEVLNRNNIYNKLLRFVDDMKNARQIHRIVKEAISACLVNEIL